MIVGDDGGTGSSPQSAARGLGDGTFAPELRLVAGSLPSASAVADFDADGLTDVAVADQDGVVHVYLRR